MSRTSVFAVVAVSACASLYATPAFAPVDCGPHAYHAWTSQKPGGGEHHQCYCVRGYVPISRAIVTGPKGSLLRPPRCIPAGGSARRATARNRSAAPPPTIRRRGSYAAEPAREPARQAAPSEETSRPQRELGATAPGQAELPRPNAINWSGQFPSATSPAAVKLDQKNFSHIREVPLPSPQWLGETAHETAKEQAFNFAYGKLPLGELVNRIRDLRDRLKKLGQTQKTTVEEYTVQVFKLEKNTVACVTSAGTCPQALESEGVQKKFASAESKLKDDWLSQQLSTPYRQLWELPERKKEELSEPAKKRPEQTTAAAKEPQQQAAAQPAPEGGPIFQLPACGEKRCVVQNPGAFVPCASKVTIGDPKAEPPVSSMLPEAAPNEILPKEEAAICAAAYDNFRQNMQSNVLALRGADVRQWSDAFLLSEHQQVVEFKRTSAQQNASRCSSTNSTIAAYTNTLHFCSTLP